MLGLWPFLYRNPTGFNNALNIFSSEKTVFSQSVFLCFKHQSKRIFILSASKSGLFLAEPNMYSKASHLFLISRSLMFLPVSFLITFCNNRLPNVGLSVRIFTNFLSL